MKQIQYLIGTMLFITLALPASGADLPDDAVALNARNVQAPPEWALKQRLLIDENTRAVHAYYNKFWDERGYLKCIERWSIVDGVDDVMQGMANVPLLYALGADESLLDIFYTAFEGNIEQYSTRPVAYAPDWGVFRNEFVAGNDMFHIVEQYTAFNQLILADPRNPRYADRAVRFAGFYLNEGLPEDAEPIYDFEHNIIRSSITGSKGAFLEITDQFWGHKWEEIGARGSMAFWTNVKGDIPMNLAVVPKVVNAYLLTGEPRYRDWVQNYFGAWIERAAANDCILPANVGLSGIVGEHWDGKWWTHIHGNWRNWRGFLPAAEVATLMTGDMRYYDAIRKQILSLHEKAIEENGKLFPPASHTDEGWTGKGRFAHQLVRLYLAEFRDADLQLLEDEIERFGRPARFNYNTDYFYHTLEIPWLYFVLGKNDEFPIKMMDSDLARIRSRIAGMQRDESVDWERRSDHHHNHTPTSTHALVNLIGGGVGVNLSKGPFPIKAEVWPFDPTRNRPGLPENVAMMVDRITKDTVSLHVVNLNQSEPRTLVIQAGAFGEHQCLKLSARGQNIDVNSHYFVVNLEPGCGERIVLTVQRYANRPRIGLPWE